MLHILLDINSGGQRYRRLREFVRIAHAVHPVIRDPFPLIRIAAHVVVIVVPQERIGTHPVLRSVVPQEPLLGCIVVKILKPDLGSLVDRIRDRIHNIKQLVIVRFDPVCHIHVPRQFCRLLFTGHFLQFADQNRTLFFRNKAAGRYCVDQELELRNFHRTPSQEK